MFVFTEDPGNGSPLYADLFARLSKAGFDVSSCFLRGRRNDLSLVNSIYIEEAIGEKPGEYDTVRELARVIREERPDIVHAHKHKATVYSVWASLFARGPKIVAHVHGLGRTRNFKRKISNFFTYRFLSAIVAVSNVVKDDILKNNLFVDKQKVKVVYNGIDPVSVAYGADERKEARKTLGIAEDEFAYVTVGRLVPTKGQSYMLEAFSMLRPRGVMRVYMIGSGPLEAELKGQAEKLGIADKVKFLGYRNDVGKLLCGFDCFVFPSVAEGFPLAILEAMAAGVCIAAADVGGIKEALTGIARIVEPKNSEALAKAMAEVIDMDEGERYREGRALRLKVEESFTVTKMARAFIDVYGEVLKNA